MEKVENKVFLITGGAAGVGAGMVTSFLLEGAKHVAFLDINTSCGKKIEKDLQKQFGPKKTKFYKCDVTNDDELFGIFENVINEFGYIDAVINNAAIFNDSKDYFRTAIQVNVAALITSSLKALDVMRKDRGGKGGTIINIASVAALMQIHVFPVYQATKSAVLQFSNCLGLEPHFSRTGVRVIAVCFGGTDTAMVAKGNFACIDEETTKEMDAVLSATYLQKPESAVAAVVAAFKEGASGSTWIGTDDKAPEDITQNIKNGYAAMNNGIFPIV